MGPDCDALLHELAHFLHGELDADRTARLREHLEDCPPCFETADFQAQLRQLMAKRCREEVPPDFQARVVAMLRVEVDPS
jgi:anti-sigma factor (TIGR02949 family)